MILTTIAQIGVAVQNLKGEVYAKDIAVVSRAISAGKAAQKDIDFVNTVIAEIVRMESEK